MDADRIKEIEDKIADLKARWPTHSVPTHMWRQLEELERAQSRYRQMTEGIFDVGQARMLDNTHRIRELRPRELLTDVAGIAAGMTCVDFGCGTGTFTLLLAEMLGATGRVYAVDKSPKMLEHIRAKNPPPNVTVIQSNVEETGLDDRIADICLLSSILHEVKQSARLMAEVSRLLKAGGRVVIVEFKKDAEAPGPPKKVRISQEQLQRLCRGAGLSLTSYEEWSESYYVAVAVK